MRRAGGKEDGKRAMCAIPTALTNSHTFGIPRRTDEGLLNYRSHGLGRASSRPISPESLPVLHRFHSHANAVPSRGSKAELAPTGRLSPHRAPRTEHPVPKNGSCREEANRQSAV